MTAQDVRMYLGQRLSVGFDGPVIPEEYENLIREYKIGNVILFRRNVKDYAQLKALCASLRTLIKAETGLEPFIMIDEECGSVSRLGHIAGATPSAMAIGATNEKENAYRIGRIMGDELHAVGINFDLAPVLDCFTNPDNTVCGNRCFAKEPEKVASFGLEYIKGLQDAGIVACGKHFPGHGDTAVDSHLDLPIVNKSIEEMRTTELVPFSAAIRAGIGSIMSAHVVFPAIEPERVPSTVSHRVMTGLLRKELGFNGIIVSDGMEMKAVMNLFGVEEGIRRALNAGIDVALICHSADQAIATICHLEKAYEEGTLSKENIEEHFQRIAACKSRLKPLHGGAPFGTQAQRDQAQRIMEASIQLLHAPEGKPLPPINGSTLFFGTLARRNALVNDDIPLNAAEQFAQAYGGVYAGLAPDREADTAVVFLGRHPDAHITIDAARKLAESGAKVIAVSLYTPRCLDFLPDNVWKIAAWQYDQLAVDALISQFPRLQAQGR
ncbi:MAG: beta-N-acetylhexosaminidase [Clostridia bacterium]|nr:beta-N-acetylhexosaminidase [Clostridia bacterium]